MVNPGEFQQVKGKKRGQQKIMSVQRGNAVCREAALLSYVLEGL